MFLTIFLSFQHWVQLSFTVHTRGGGLGGIAGDVQRKIPLEHHCCEAVFSKLVHSRIHSRSNVISQSRPFLHSSSCIMQIYGTLQSDCSGFWTAACFFFNKNNLTRVDSGVCCVCRGCPQLSGWVGGHRVKFNFGRGNVHVGLGHSAACLACFALLSNITLWLRFSRLEWLSVQSAKHLFYWTPWQLNLATLSCLPLS